MVGRMRMWLALASVALATAPLVGGAGPASAAVAALFYWIATLL